MSRPLINEDYLKFRIWLDAVVSIDPFDFADWLHENAHRVALELEDCWSQDDVGACLREQFVSENRLNIYPSRKVES